jgi:methylated-DNA-[protein]-cysteine S-methyltransferase
MSGSTTRGAGDFERRVLAAVRRIPPGRVATYGDIAALAGAPRAARAVGNILRRTKDPVTPCHRVVAAGGAIGGYGGSESMKRELLRREGAETRGSRITHFEAIRWRAAERRGASSSVVRRYG